MKSKNQKPTPQENNAGLEWIAEAQVQIWTGRQECRQR